MGVMRKQKPEVNPFLNGWKDIYQGSWAYKEHSGKEISFWPSTTFVSDRQFLKECGIKPVVFRRTNEALKKEYR